MRTVSVLQQQREAGRRRERSASPGVGVLITLGFSSSSPRRRVILCHRYIMPGSSPSGVVVSPCGLSHMSSGGWKGRWQWWRGGINVIQIVNTAAYPGHIKAARRSVGPGGRLFTSSRGGLTSLRLSLPNHRSVPAPPPKKKKKKKKKKKTGAAAYHYRLA